MNSLLVDATVDVGNTECGSVNISRGPKRIGGDRRFEACNILEQQRVAVVGPLIHDLASYAGNFPILVDLLGDPPQFPDLLKVGEQIPQ